MAVPQTALRNVPKLKRLSLSFNRIAVVSGELFSSMPLLKTLSLSYNVIRELNEESFQSLKSLRKLDLRGNQVNVTKIENNSNAENCSGKSYVYIIHWFVSNITRRRSFL